MDLQQICTLVKLMNKRSVNIDAKITNFVLVRDMNVTDEVKTDNPDAYRMFAQCMRYLPASEREYLNKGFHLIAIQADEKEFYPVENVDENRIILGKEPVLEFKKPIFTSQNKNAWVEYPNETLNTVLEVLDSNYRAVGSIMNTKNNNSKKAMKTLVDFKDMLMRLRIKVGNTLVNNTYLSMGQEKYDKFAEEVKDVPKYLLSEYKSITEKVVANIVEDKQSIPVEMLDVSQGVTESEDGEVKKNASSEKIINSLDDLVIKKGKLIKGSMTEKVWDKYGSKNSTALIPSFQIYKYLDVYFKLMKMEEELTTTIKDQVHKEKLWTEYLSGIRGCGELSAAYIIATLDPKKARHPSGFISYAGLDVRRDAKGNERGTCKGTLKPVVFLDTKGEAQVTSALGYDPKFKARIVGVLVDCFIKAGGKYADIYRSAKTYYQNRPDLKEVFEDKKNSRTPNKMARRKVASLFLTDLWVAWRRLEGLPLNGGTYAEEKLHIIHQYDRPTLENIKDFDKKSK